MTDYQVSGLTLEVFTEAVKTDWNLRKHFNTLNFEFTEFFEISENLISVY